MKRILLLSVAVITALSVFAQNYKQSAGLVLGSLEGISYKTFVSDNLAVQVDLGLGLVATSGNAFTSSTYAEDIYKDKNKINLNADAGLLSFQLAPNFVWQKNIASFDWANLDLFVGGGITIGYAKFIQFKATSIKSTEYSYENNKEVYRSEAIITKTSYEYANYIDGKEISRNKIELEEQSELDDEDYSNQLGGDFGKFGINAIAGVELALKGAPITLGIDFRPGYGVMFTGHDEDYKKVQEMAEKYEYEYSETAPIYNFFDWSLAVTVRYTF